MYSIAFYFLIFDDPSLHPRIQQSEKYYIQKALGDKKAKAVIRDNKNNIWEIQGWINWVNGEFVWLRSGFVGSLVDVCS